MAKRICQFADDSITLWFAFFVLLCNLIFSNKIPCNSLTASNELYFLLGFMCVCLSEGVVCLMLEVNLSVVIQYS